MFEVVNLSLSYKLDGQDIDILKRLNLKVNPGEFVGIQGPSGSGKSTLFYVLGFLLKPTSGTVLFDGLDITKFSEDELAAIRNQKIGFIFQQFHLLSKTSTLKNILLPTRYPSELADPGAKETQKALILANQLGLAKHLEHFPNQLSGGQQQRVAIARALMNDIDLILADEPTGNLDSKNAMEVLDLLSELNRNGKTIILITHDSEVAKRCSRVYYLKDGAFTHSIENFSPTLPPILLKERNYLSLPKEVNFKIYQKIIKSVFPLVTENLLRNKAKSILTMLGVVIGVAAVLVTVTLGQFAKNKILETYEALGVNKVLIRGYPNRGRKATDVVSVNFTSFDWEKEILPLRRVFPEIKLMSPSLLSFRNLVLAGGVEAGENKVTSLGVSTEFLTITNRGLDLGRNISPYHIINRSPVCLIGSEIAQRLFSRTNPLGQVISVNNGQNTSYPCQVIGVLSPKTSNEDWSPPNLHVLLPFTYFQTAAGNWWNAQIHEVTLQVASDGDIVSTGKKIKSYFDQKYGKSGIFFVDSDSTLIAQMKKFLNIFGILLSAIALLSLIVGGIGINNMMLVSVTERIKEFGIRKALGATNRSIRVQVLLESVCLCAAAGVLGVILGFGTYQLMILGATKFIPTLKYEWLFEPIAVFLSLFSIVAVGIASGFVPALKAEKLQVIEALRSE